MYFEAIGAANHDLDDIELMTDRAVLEDLSDVFRGQGSMLVCHFCDDVSEIIAGILVDKESEKAWVLCGPCLRQVPLQGTLASQ
jgi:hypothetical protein